MLVQGVESGAVDRLVGLSQGIAVTGGRGLDRLDRIAIGLCREAPDPPVDEESGAALTSSTRQ